MTFFYQGVFALFLLASILKSCRSSILDDNYCDDRLHGRDEKFSSACSGLVNGLTVKCLDQRFVIQRIYASRVGDGICDCCDGSDESPEVCPRVNSNTDESYNSCERTGVALKESMRDGVQKKIAGSKKKRELVAATQKRFADTKAAVDKEIREGPKLDASIKAIEERLDDAARAESVALESKVQEAKLIFNAAIAALAENLESNVLVKFVAALTIRSREEATETIGASLPRDPGTGEPDLAEAMIIAMEGPMTKDGDITLGERENSAELVINIDGVPVAGPASYVLNRAKLSNTVLDDMQVALAISSDVEKVKLIPVLQAAVAEAQLEQVVLLSALDAGVFGEATLAEIMPLVEALPPCHYLVQKRGMPSKEGDSLREELAQLRAERVEMINKSKDAGALMSHKDADFGPDSRYFAFHGMCFKKRLGYQYSACPFGEAHQGNVLLGRYAGIEFRPTRHVKGGSSSSSSMLELSDALRAELGLEPASSSSFSAAGAGDRQEEQEQEQEMWMTFRGGSYCHPAKRPREMHLRLECYDETLTELVDVMEPETCSYTGVLKTPLAC